MLMAGVHPKIVSECLGHSSVTITLDTYNHARPATTPGRTCKSKAAAVLGGLFDDARRTMRRNG